MPGIQDLLALVGGGGGAPGGAPPPGGGAPPPGMPPGAGGGAPPGAALQQILGQLMQNPAAMKAMQQYAMQMLGGGGGGGAAPPMAQPPGDAQAGPPGMPMPPDMPPGLTPGGGPPDGAEKMASDQIDKSGATFDGSEAPTQNDIERLKEDPTPEMIKAFDEQFGQGAAEAIVGDQGGDKAPDESEQGGPPENQEAGE